MDQPSALYEKTENHHANMVQSGTHQTPRGSEMSQVKPPSQAVELHQPPKDGQTTTPESTLVS